MTPGEIAGAAAATIEVGKTAIEIAKSLLAFGKSVEFKAAIADLLGKLADEAAERATEANERRQLIDDLASAERTIAQLLEEKRRLEEELADAKKRKSDFERYQLVRVCDDLALYTLKKSAANNEPAHWLCPHCFADGKKGILQTEPCYGGTPEQTIVKCPVCGFTESVLGCVRPSYV